MKIQDYAGIILNFQYFAGKLLKIEDHAGKILQFRILQLTLSLTHRNNSPAVSRPAGRPIERLGEKLNYCIFISVRLELLVNIILEEFSSVSSSSS